MTGITHIATEISKGNLENKIALRSENDALMAGLNNMTKSLKEVIADIYNLSEAAVNGELSRRVDITKHQGDFKKIISGVNDTLDAVVIPLNVAASYMNNLSKGITPDLLEEEL